MVTYCLYLLHLLLLGMAASNSVSLVSAWMAIFFHDFIPLTTLTSVRLNI